MKDEKINVATVKRYLAHQGHTYRWFARVLSRSPENVQRWWTENYIPIKHAPMISVVLGIPLIDLYRED